MRTRPGFEIVIQRMGGMTSIIGGADIPTSVSASIADLTTSVFAAVDIHAALLRRAQISVVRRVDVARLDCQLTLLENAAFRFLLLKPGLREKTR